MVHAVQRPVVVKGDCTLNKERTDAQELVQRRSNHTDALGA